MNALSWIGGAFLSAWLFLWAGAQVTAGGIHLLALGGLAMLLISSIRTIAQVAR